MGDVLFRQRLDTRNVLSELDIDSCIPLQRLKQPSTTPLVTFPPVAPAELFDFLGRKDGFIVLLGKHPSVVDHVQENGTQETEAADESDEEVSCGRDEFVGCPSDGTKRREVNGETTPARGTGPRRSWWLRRWSGRRVEWSSWSAIGTFPERLTAYHVSEGTVRGHQGPDGRPDERPDERFAGRERRNGERAHTGNVGVRWACA